MATAIETGRAERYDAGTNDEYHAGDGVSNSRLKDFRKHPALYHAYYVAKSLPKPGPTPAMQVGTALDELVTLGEFETCAEIPRDVLNKDGHKKGKAWTEFAEANADKVLFKSDQIQAVYRMRDAIMRHNAARQLLANIADRAQVSLRMTCPNTGLLLRCKLDALHPTIAVDLKKTCNADPLKFAYSCLDLGYASQAVFYSRLAKSYLGIDDIRFLFVAVEEEFPFRVEVYELAPEFIEEAAVELDSTLEQLAECYDTGVWELPHHGRIVTLPKPYRKNWSA